MKTKTPMTRARKWLIAAGAVALAGVVLVVGFVAMVAGNLGEPSGETSPKIAALLAQPMPKGPEFGEPWTASSATSGTAAWIGGGDEETIFPADMQAAIRRHQALTKEYLRWREAHRDSLILNTDAVPLDSDKPLLPMKEEYDERQRKLVEAINSQFDWIRRDLREYFAAAENRATFEELYPFLRRVRSGSFNLSMRVDELTTGPPEEKLVDGQIQGVSMIADIYTMEQGMVVTGELWRFSENTIRRLAHDHERWDVAMQFVPWTEQLDYVHRMEGAQRYVYLADWTLENDVQRPFKNWMDDMLAPARRLASDAAPRPAVGTD
jgi:hypothetical protein